MRRTAAVAALTLVLAVSGCGGDDADETTDTAGSDTPSAAASEPSAAAGAGGAEAKVLTGSVGQKGDPDAFVISLTDASGEQVESLPAGTYTINVQDRSEIHNFHLEGGDVDETTTVPETTEASWTVELTAGDYEAICDPHSNMRLSFTVT